jgi:opacity protein-like surface antigen
MVMDTDVDTTGLTPNTGKMTFDNGFVGSVAVGYTFSIPMRLEFEIVKHKNDITLSYYDPSFVAGNDGDLKSHSFMANAFYDVDTGSAWTPYIGFGMGWSQLDIDTPAFYTSDTDDVFAYQFMGGVAYAFNEQWSVDAQYRFMGSDEATIGDSDFDVNSNNLMVGVRFSF